MKMIFLTVSVIILALASCSKSDSTFQNAQVRILPSITRVTGLHFDPDDAIGMSIAKGSEDYVTNRKMVYDGTAFTADGLIWYDDSGVQSTLTAYYPYNSEAMPMQFTIQTDQTSGFESSDLLVARKEQVTPTPLPVGMQFNHVMSRLTIIITNSSDATVTGVTISGFVPTADVDYTVPSAVARTAGASASVEACEKTPGTTYQAILVPQQNALTVSLTTSDGKPRTTTYSSALLESGKPYSMSLVMTNDAIDVKLSGDVVDWGEDIPIDGDNGDGLTYKGASYTTGTFGGKVWMTQNLRYVPDDALLRNGVWYPSRDAVEEQDKAYVAERGMLYNVATAFGNDPLTSTQPVQGICPTGWHLPKIEELQALVASDEYEQSVWQTAGMWNATTSKYGASSKGYFMSSSMTNGGANFTALLCQEAGGTPQTVDLSVENGVSVRCIKN